MYRNQPYGDANGLRHAAAQLNTRADRAVAVRARIVNQASQMTFAGPAADSFRQRVNEMAEFLSLNISLIREVADKLTAAAAQIEASDQYRGGPR